jgi:TRAP-type C4-dicarboxylate transport system permease small subunit
MDKLFTALGLAFRLLTFLAFLVLIGAVALQVTARLTLPNSPAWTEELSRFALLFLVAFGCGLGWRSGELVNVDVVLARLDERGRLVLEIVIVAITVAFALLLLRPAWNFVRIGAVQTSPALGWSMFWIHLTVLLAPISLAVFALERAWRLLKKRP